MRGVLLLCMTLATAALSGCAELVEDPEALAEAAPEAADQAAAILDEVAGKPGHLAGSVADDAGVALAGASVLLVSSGAGRVTAGDGEFAFVDVPAGTQVVQVSADGFLLQEVAVEVLPGEVARVAVALSPLPPEPVFEVHQLDGWSNLDTGVLGSMFCSCRMDFPVGPGLTQVVVEAVVERGSLTSSDHLRYSLSLSNDDESTYYDGEGSSPLREVLAVEPPANATSGSVFVDPDSGIYPELSQEFTVYLTLVYNGVAPEGYTAVPQPE